MSFKSLKLKELQRTALEDFAVDFEESDTKENIIAALIESGVTWDMYCEANGIEKKKPEAVDQKKVDPKKVKTREPGVDENEGGLYLVRMDRNNPYFEYRGYKFTKENPYVVMPADMANAILRNEDGFALASPGEAAEFYDKV